MAEPIFAITDRKLLPYDVSPDNLGVRGVDVQPRTEEGNPLLVIAKDGSMLMSIDGKILTINLEDHNVKNVAKALNHVKIFYYGWPLTFSAKKSRTTGERVLAYDCNSRHYVVGPDTRPVRC